MKNQVELERAIVRGTKAKADLAAALATLANVIVILGTVLAIVGSFRLVEMLLVK